MQIQMMKPEELVPYARNARTHPDWQIAQIAASIAEFGFTNPVLLGADGVIIAGHGRVMAAQRLALAEVPVIVLGHLSPVQQRALVLADNRIAENAGWDEEMLEAELRALQLEGFELEIVGFSEAELDEILAGGEPAGPAPKAGEPDFVPPVEARPVSRLGDVWILGNHRVMCGDSCSIEAMQHLCGDGLVDCVWTDPPYNVNYEGSAGKIQNDNMGSTDFRRFLLSAFAAAFGVMRAGAPIYVAHADTEGLNFRAAFRDAGFKLSGCLVWVKPSLVLGRSDYQWRHEPILYGWKPGASHSWHGARNKTTVVDAVGSGVRVMADGSLQVDVGDQTIVVTGEKLSIEALDGSVVRYDKPARNGEHPTMKPVGLIEGFLQNSSVKGEVVLDPFGGSGSTLIACHGLGRSARLMELEPKFVDVIVRRWEGFTGLRAVLDGDGRSFEEVGARPRKAA